MKIVVRVLVALLVAAIAGHFGGWWAFGIVAAIGVIVAISVGGTPAGGTGGAGGGGGKKKSTAVEILENVGAIAALVVFGAVAFGLLGVLQTCSTVATDAWTHVSEYKKQAEPKPAAPAPKPAKEVVAGRETFVYPTGTTLRFIATGDNCGEWRLRIMDKEIAEAEKASGKEVASWYTVKDQSEFYWTLNRPGWVDTMTQEGCHLTVQPIQ